MTADIAVISDSPIVLIDEIENAGIKKGRRWSSRRGEDRRRRHPRSMLALGGLPEDRDEERRDGEGDRDDGRGAEGLRGPGEGRRLADEPAGDDPAGRGGGGSPLKMVVVAGTPGSGKTSVLIHAARSLQRMGVRPAVVKIVLWTEDDERFRRLGVPVAVGLSKDMCPDHYSIYNVDEMLDWAKEEGADVLLNETAASASGAPLPRLRPGGMRPRRHLRPQRPPQGGAAPDFDWRTSSWRRGGHGLPGREGGLPERSWRRTPLAGSSRRTRPHRRGGGGACGSDQNGPDLSEEMLLRHSPPLAICTLCAGELRVSKEHHRGVLRHLDGFMEYTGE